MDFLTHENGNYGPEIEGAGQTNETNCLSQENQTEEPDRLPEYCQYRDEGCEYAKSCLSCPFPQCLYDEPRGRQRWKKGIRNRKINQLFSEGRDIQELATLFGVSRRTIQRAVKQLLSNGGETDKKPIANSEQITKVIFG